MAISDREYFSALFGLPNTPDRFGTILQAKQERKQRAEDRANAPVRAAQSAADQARARRLQAERDTARQQREAEIARERALANFNRNLDQAFSGSLGEAERYFTSRGVDPNKYRSDIEQAAISRRGNVPSLSDDISSYFSGLGSQVYNDLTSALRNRASKDVNRIASNFQPIGTDVDDSIIEQILSQQTDPLRQQAQIQFDRGVLTDSGLERIFSDIETQTGTARNRLQDIGSGVINQANVDFSDFIDRGREQARQADLSQGFDTTGFESDLGKQVDSFFNSLSDRIGSQTPGDLFNVTGLSALGASGRSRGTVENIPFEEDEEDDDVDESGTF